MIKAEDVELYPLELAERYARQFAVPLDKRFPFVRELFAPVHAAGHPGERAAPDHFLRLDSGWALAGPLAHSAPADDLLAFLQTTFSVTLQRNTDCSRCLLTLDIDPSLPSQAFRLAVRRKDILLLGGDAAGVMYGVHRLEEMMAPYAVPALPPGTVEYRPALHTRIYRSPVAPYYVNEALTGEDYYPETLCDRLAHHGFNGIWLRGRLRDLARSPLFPTYGEQADVYLAYLRRLIESAGRYHIGVYLYLTEPLGMAEDDPLWAEFPHVRGAQSLLDKTYALCTALPEVRDHLRESTARLGRALPGLRGIIQISASEHQHHCWSQFDPRGALGEWFKPPQCPCPRCADRDPRDVVAEVLTLVHEGLHAELPAAHHIAWNWSWCMYEADPQRGILERLPRDIAVMGDFERGLPQQVGEKEFILEEYSISTVGPSPRFTGLAEACAGLGLDCFARIQLPVTHETPTLPEWPLFPKVAEKCRRMIESGTSGVMACWNFGNYPGISTELCRRFSWEPCPPPDTVLAEVAERHFGPEWAPIVLQAWEIFSRATDAYPRAMDFLYYAPVSRGPAMPFFTEPTGRPMPKPYLLDGVGDRIGEYTVTFSAPELCVLLDRVLAAWSPGVELLKTASSQAGPYQAALTGAYATSAMFACMAQSARNFTEFISLRDQFLAGSGGLTMQLRALMEDELANCRRACEVIVLDSRLGFHGEAHGYLITREAIEEKIAGLEAALAQWPGALVISNK